MPLQPSHALAITLVVLAACRQQSRPAGPPPAAEPTPSAVTTSAQITAGELAHRLSRLAHDSMMGRMTGREGNFLATEYVAAEFRRMGLEPAGENDTYFQTVPFHRFAVNEQATIDVDGVTLNLWTDFVPSPILAAARPLDGVSAVYGGPATDSTRWLSAEEASGRLVVLDVPAGPSGRREFVRLRPILRSPRFARAAALAVAELDLIVPRDMAPDAITTDTALTTAIPPQLFISARAAATLLGGEPAGLATGAVGRRVRATPMVVRTALRYPARNVVAILRGSDPALRSTYVSLTAHNDHVGYTRSPVDHDSLRAFNRVVRPMGADSPPRPATEQEMARVRQILDSLRAIRPPRPDSIQNGADDDGSGTVAILEIAQALAARPDRPRRSVLFVSHTAEEVGLRGSRWFTDHPTVPRDSIVAEIDLDMIGRGTAQDLPGGGPHYLEVIGARRLSTEFGDILERVNAGQPTPFRFNYEFDAPNHPLQYYCRADHYSYARYGIPSVALSRGGHLDYHQATDEAQYISYGDLARVARLVHDAALAIANLDHRPLVDKPKPDPGAPCRQ